MIRNLILVVVSVVVGLIALELGARFFVRLPSPYPVEDAGLWRRLQERDLATWLGGHGRG